MACLDNLIGISSVCDEVQSLSGLTINNLPGMTVRIAESVITNEDISGKKIIEEKIKFAQKSLTNDLRNYLHDKFKLNSILFSDLAGIYKEDQSIISSTNKIRGVRIVVNDHKYTDVQISRIGIKLTSVVSDFIYVYDLTSGQELDKIPFTSKSDEVVYVDVNRSYKTGGQRQSIFISIDASVSDQYAIYSGGHGCSTCAKRNTISWSSFGSISGQPIDSNFISSNNASGGLTVSYNISCDIERYFCSFSQTLAWPLLYKTGAEIMREVIFSRNLNSIVLIDSENSEKLLEYYEYEYSKAMTNIASGLKIPDDICFECNKKIKRTIQIP